MQPKRSVSELPGLKRFRLISLVLFAASLAAYCFLLTAMVPPDLQKYVGKSATIFLILTLFAGVVLFRAQVICYQTQKQVLQSFYRSCPEWITLTFALLILLEIFWA